MLTKLIAMADLSTRGPGLHELLFGYYAIAYSLALEISLWNKLYLEI
jgi:hypothetical protein